MSAPSDRDLAQQWLAEIIVRADQGRGMGAIHLAAAILDTPGVHIIPVEFVDEPGYILLRLPVQPANTGTP